MSVSYAFYFHEPSPVSSFSSANTAYPRGRRQAKQNSLIRFQRARPTALLTVVVIKNIQPFPSSSTVEHTNTSTAVLGSTLGKTPLRVLILHHERGRVKYGAICTQVEMGKIPIYPINNYRSHYHEGGKRFLK